MEKMRFHWKDGKGESGFFTVTAPSVTECIELAEEEISEGAVLTDYYSLFRY